MGLLLLALAACGGGSAAPLARPPARPRPPGSFLERAVTVGVAPWQLPGTLTIPEGAGPFPAVVLVHGSGPEDRDETIGPNKPFRDLAQGLAGRGIAVLRYDKRTLVHRDEVIKLADLTVEQEVVTDALAAVALARATPGIDPHRVFLLGHSLGGYLVPRIVSRDDSIAGAVILSGNARPMQDLIVEQLDYIAGADGAVSPDEKAQIDQMKAELARLSDPALSAASPPVLGVPATYWLDLRAYDPVAAARSITRPLLVLQGGRDYQVTRTDFDLWQRGLAGHPNVSFRMFPDLNHLYVTGTGPSTPAEYARPGHVAPAAIEEIARFVSTPPRRR